MPLWALLTVMFTLTGVVFSGCAPLGECYAWHTEQQERLVSMRGHGWATKVGSVRVCDVRLPPVED